MAKVIEIRTISRPFTAYTRDQVHEDIKKEFLDNGWDLFETHLAGFTGPELAVIFVLVKYADDTQVTYAPMSAMYEPVAAKKRGRPAKVQPVEEVAEG